jgi:hypothetical protein
VSPAATRGLPPATAVRLLVGASLVTAIAGGFGLAVAAFTVAAQDAEIAELGHWSGAALRVMTPIPPVAGAVAGVLVVPLFLAAATRLLRAGRQLWAADVTCRELGKGVDGLIVIRDEQPDAYALQGLRGRTVVSSGMLAALSPAQRRALLAHEASHLANRHPLLVLLADVAAANPLLRSTAAAVRAGVERWADEDAAAVVGDRRLVAQALARASLASSGHAARGRPYALSMTDASVAGRARALLAPTPKPRRVLAGLLLALTVATGASAIAVGQITDVHFDRAQASQPGR